MNVIFEYIRKRRGGKSYKTGVIIGIRDGDTVKVGWSKCNGSAGDKFDVVTGIQMAKDRANKIVVDAPVPDCIRTQLRQFSARCCRYFKEAKKLEMP